MKAALGVLFGLGLALPTAGLSDPVLDWNVLMLDAIRADTTAPTLSTRNLAILNTAMYDAVNSVTRTHQPYWHLLSTPSNTSAEAAAVGAAYEVVVLLYPSFEYWADDLFNTWLATVPQDEALTNGLSLGQDAGLLAVAFRGDDGSSLNVTYVPSSAPGQWQRTPPYFRPPLTPQWRYVAPFCLPDIEPFVPAPPPAPDSPQYAAALNEVKTLGSVTSTMRTPEQSQIAVFWSDFSYTAMPPGHWHDIASTIARSRTNSLAENARLFALLSLAQADAAIVCWEAKYRYNLWRPVTAIQRADEDGNLATEKDPTWNHYLAAPPFPSYTSGHSTFSKASADVIARFYGTDAISFTATSDSLPGVTRSFASLSACADEVGMSRIYGGIHFQFDNTAGKGCGRQIADYVSANFLLPSSLLPLVRIEGFSNGAPRLRVHGHLGCSWVLESTTDFTNWRPLCTNSAVPGGTMLSDEMAGTQPLCFYRVVEIR